MGRVATGLSPLKRLPHKAASTRRCPHKKHELAQRAIRLVLLMCDIRHPLSIGEDAVEDAELAQFRTRAEEKLP